jgi:hypothetical protein
MRSNLIAQPGQFVNARTGRPYVGAYHTHNGEPMVGATHTSRQHDYLTRHNNFSVATRGYSPMNLNGSTQEKLDHHVNSSTGGRHRKGGYGQVNVNTSRGY